MSQRVAKVESLIQQTVAVALVDQLGTDSARVTVTRVDAAPDMRNATVWIGLLGRPLEQEKLWKHIEQSRFALQEALGARMSMKFVPRLHLKQDTGGEYAAEIDRLLREI